MDYSKRVHELPHENPVAVSKSIEKILDDSQHTGELLLSAKKLTDLPASIINYDLSDLYFVDLSRNTLGDLPYFLFNFLSLEHLDCRHNFIRSIPASVSTFKHLVVLDLSHNLLTTFPSYACHFQCLEVLNLSSNKISSLPEDVGLLQSLMEMNLSRNLLSELPNTVGHLQSLRHLNVHHNQLTSLNPVLTSLHLVKLDVSVNKISRIPLDLYLMATLDDLNICNNPLVMPPQHVVVRGRQHVMAYLASEQQKQQRMKLRQGFSKGRMQKNGLSSSTIVFRSISHDDHQLNKQMSDSDFDMSKSTTKTFGSNRDPGSVRSITRNVTRRHPSNENMKASSCSSMRTSPSRTQKDVGVSVQRDAFKTSQGTSGYVSDDNLVGRQPESPQSFTSTETLNFNESPQSSFLSLDDDASSVGSISASSDHKPKVNGTSGSRPNLIDIGFIVEEKAANSLEEREPSAQIDGDEDGEQLEFYKRYSNFVSQRKKEAAKIMELADDQISTESKNSVLSPKCKKMLETLKGELSEHNPLLTIRRNMHQLEKENYQVKSLKKVLETLLKRELEGDVSESLKDGVVLCELANQILPNSVPHIYTSTPDTKLSEPKCRKNVENFLNVCRRLGLSQENVLKWQYILDVELLGMGGSLTRTTCERDVLEFRKQKVFKNTGNAPDEESLIFNPTLQDHAIAIFCILFFLSTCLFLHWHPLPS